MGNLLLTCLFGFIMIHHRACQPRVTLDLEERSVERITILAKFFRTPSFVVNLTIDITSPSLLNLPDFRPDRRLTKSDNEGYTLEGAYNIPIIGLQYIITAQITVRQGSPQGPLRVGEDVVIYNSAPLPPSYFEMSVEGDSAHFMFLAPRNQSENGTAAFYDYLLISCYRYYNLSIVEGGRTVSKTIYKNSNLVNHRIVETSWPLRGNLQKVFSNGSAIECTLRATSEQDIIKYSQPLRSSFVIAPTLPQVTLYESVKSEYGVDATLLIEKQVEGGSFSLIRLSYSPQQECTYTLNNFTESSTLCQLLSLPASGSLSKFNLAVYSHGESYERKISSSSISIIIPPLPPKEMLIDLRNGEVAVSLILESPSVHAFHYLYLNSSDDPTSIVKLRKEEVTSHIKWHKLPHGLKIVFNCWTSVIFDRKEVLSRTISAEYITAPALPQVTLYESVKSEYGVDATLLIEQQVTGGSFSLIRLSYSPQQECTYTMEKMFGNSTLCQLSLTASGILLKLNLTVYSQGPENKRQIVSSDIFIIIPPLPPKEMYVGLRNGEVAVSFTLESPYVHAFHYLYLNSSDNATFIVKLRREEVRSHTKWHRLPLDSMIVFSCWTSVIIRGQEVLSNTISVEYITDKYFNDSPTHVWLALAIVSGIILLLSISLLTYGCIRQQKVLFKVHSKSESKSRISIATPISVQELEERKEKVRPIIIAR